MTRLVKNCDGEAENVADNPRPFVRLELEIEFRLVHKCGWATLGLKNLIREAILYKSNHENTVVTNILYKFILRYQIDYLILEARTYFDAIWFINQQLGNRSFLYLYRKVTRGAEL